MSDVSPPQSRAVAVRPRRSSSPQVRRIIGVAAVVVLIGLMLLGTKFVPKGSTLGAGPAAFDPAAYGVKQFPSQQQFITSHAVVATTLAAAVKKDQTAAATKYGVSSDSGATVVVPVTFTGKVGTVPAAGYTPIAVGGLPSGLHVAAQLGPAITGTDIRDASGTIQLGSFENQIQYQNAGDAINDELKKVLAAADGGEPTSLQGKTVTITGVFQLVNPDQWNVTPATIAVK